MIPTDEAVLITDPHYDTCPETERYGEDEEPRPDDDVDPASDRISGSHDMVALLREENERALHREHCCDDEDAGAYDWNDANDEEG